MNARRLVLDPVHGLAAARLEVNGFGKSAVWEDDELTGHNTAMELLQCF